MALPQFGSGDNNLFATKRTGRTPTVIEPKTLAAVTELLTKHGIVQGQEFYTATKAETDAFNGQRETAAKSAGKEVPEPISVPAMAIRNARKAGSTIEPYVMAAIDAATEGSPLFNKSHSLRFVDQGTADHPKVLWAIVLVNPRIRTPKAETPAAETPAAS